jgi:hypothetical protein
MSNRKVCNLKLRLTADSTALNANNSPLLRLPAELRNKIYALVLDEDGYVFSYPDRPTLASGERKNRLAILSLCRQIHAETALLPFSLNKLHFFYFNGFRDLCLALGLTKRHAIHKLRLDDALDLGIEFVLDMRRVHGFDTLSQFLPNVQRVRVAASTLPSWDSQRFRDSKARYENVLTDWIRGGLKEGVDVRIEHWSPVAVLLG